MVSTASVIRVDAQRKAALRGGIKQCGWMAGEQEGQRETGGMRSPASTRLHGIRPVPAAHVCCPAQYSM